MTHVDNERVGGGRGHSPEERDAVVVLIDDTRAFSNGRPCRVARSSAAAVQLLTDLRDRHIDHLWLDHDLDGDDTIWPAIRLLEQAHLEGRPFDIGLVHIQASRSGPAHQIGVSVRRLGYATERSRDRRIWSRWNGLPDVQAGPLPGPVAESVVRPAVLDEDELWAVYTALAAWVEPILANDADVQLVMALQAEALDLVREAVAGRPGVPAAPAEHGMAVDGRGAAASHAR